MKLFARNFIVFIFSFFCFSFLFFAPFSFAAATPFRSANIITTDGTPSFINLSNCSITDGNTCDRALAVSYANLYFRDFGNYNDFGIPEGSVITKLRVRVTGKSRISPFALIVGLSSGAIYQSNCIRQQWASDPWILWYLNGQTINLKTIIADVTQSNVSGTVSAACLQPYNFENDSFIFRLHVSTAQNWSANIDNFEVAFDYDPPIIPTLTSTPTQTPTPSSTPNPTPTPKTPLILIPGIGGSELKTAETRVWFEDNGHGGMFANVYPEGEKIWVNNIEVIKPGNDDYFDILRMEDNGTINKANLVLTGDLFDGYKDTIDFFTSNGYTFNKDFFLFPYDWRKDIALTVPLLDQKINEIKTQTGSQKVDIIAHSMGGLIARSCIVDPLRAQNVRKLFTLGTPYLGAVDFLKRLRFGGCLTLPKLQSLPFCVGLVDSELKDMIQNMISGYELAPSQSYFDFYSGEDDNHPYPYKTESGSLNYDQIKNFLTGLKYNTALFNPSENFHNLDNFLSDTNGVEVIVIAGSGQPTLGQIIEENNHKDILNINGDGTVPLFSASLIDLAKNKSLLGDAKVFYTNQDHGNLVASGSALKLVKNILEENNQLPDGVSAQPYSLPLAWWIFSVHSPVNINIYDSSGNHTGLTINGDVEVNIPSSSYDTLGDAKFILIPDSGVYAIKFVATDKGSFDFKIKKYEKDTLSQEILYKDIPLTNSTKAETQFNTSSDQPPVIHLDKDGNGTIDEDINSYSGITVTASSNSNSNSGNSIASIIVPPSVIAPTSHSTYVKSNKEDILGTQTTSQKEEGKTNLKFLNEKKKVKFSLIILSTILIGVAAVIFIKLRR